MDKITPNHFLIGRPIPSIMFGEFEQLPEWEYYEEDDYSSHLSQVLNLRDFLFEEFKERWLSEYLVNLREKDRASFNQSKNWEVGEIALLKLPSKSKPFWPLVRVTDTYPDMDLVMRTVKVAKPDGSQVNVNVKHLIPLELYSELNTPNNNNINSEGSRSEDVRVETQEEALSECESGMDISLAEVEHELDGSSNVRPSRKTAQASRAQTLSLASKGLL